MKHKVSSTAVRLAAYTFPSMMVSSFLRLMASPRLTDKETLAIHLGIMALIGIADIAAEVASLKR